MRTVPEACSTDLHHAAECSWRRCCYDVLIIVVSGIQLITKWPIGPRNVTIVSVALGLGYGLGSNTAILVHLPQAISLIFGGSGIVPAAVFAIILNIVLPKDEKSEIERAEEMLEKVKNK